MVAAAASAKRVRKTIIMMRKSEKLTSLPPLTKAPLHQLSRNRWGYDKIVSQPTVGIPGGVTD